MHPLLQLASLPVGLDRLINATLGKRVVPVNSKNATICQGDAAACGRKRAAPEGAASLTGRKYTPPGRRTYGRDVFTMARKG